MTYSLYFHIPFCTHRCAYCDFNTYAGQESLIPAYVDALCREMEFVGTRLPSRKIAPVDSKLPSRTIESVESGLPSPLGGGAGGEGVHTIFFGGGTPSLLTPKQFEQILHTVRNLFDLSDLSDLETSLEANPGTVTFDSLRGLRRAGFNRISFGVQSFDPGELRQLERIHDPFDVFNAVRWARQAGFENMNLDLIYGLPEQSLARWQANVKRAVELSPQHLSLYALTIEHGTPYGRWAAHGLLPLPDPDLAADMYEWASDFLEGLGYEQYEISNWARPGFQCRHNLQYWRNLPYLGFGAGAHGCANGMRISNVLHIKTYLSRLGSDHSIPTLPTTERLIPDRLIPDHLIPNCLFPLSPATVTKIPLTRFVEMQETMMLGLRLTQEGVSAQAFRQRFGQEMQAVFGKEIDDLVGLGLLEWAASPSPSGIVSLSSSDATISPPPSGEGPGVRVDGSGGLVRLTKRGRLLGNQAFMRFVGE